MVYTINIWQNQYLNPELSDCTAFSLPTVLYWLSDNIIIMSKERNSYERLLIFKLKRKYQNSKDAQLSM